MSKYETICFVFMNFERSSYSVDIQNYNNHHLIWQRLTYIIIINNKIPNYCQKTAIKLFLYCVYSIYQALDKSIYIGSSSELLKFIIFSNFTCSISTATLNLIVLDKTKLTTKGTLM